jgi:hypothetical protein
MLFGIGMACPNDDDDDDDDDSDGDKSIHKWW